ncbi:hypothetical protein B0H11DRAFT_1920301 [Mycena galericulata]|nr:hypothetical protein B0H11DRAFT_1920301 [Mycena galericulata]
MSDPSSLGPHSVDRTFILTWGLEFIAYTLDIAKDPLAIGSTVALLAFLTTIHSLFLAMQNYKDFVLLFGNFERQDVILQVLFPVPQPFSTLTILKVMICAVFLVAFTAQIFYASRIWILDDSVEPKLAICYTRDIACHVATVCWDRSNRRSVTATIQGAATLACDVTITWNSFSHSSEIANRTDSVLEKMIIYAFNRGAITSLLALLQVVFFFAMPGTFVMLTSRETLRAKLRSISTFEMSSMEPNSTQNNLGSESTAHGVHVSTSVVKWVETIPVDNSNFENRDAIKMSVCPLA